MIFSDKTFAAVKYLSKPPNQEYDMESLNAFRKLWVYTLQAPEVRNSWQFEFLTSYLHHIIEIFNIDLFK